MTDLTEAQPDALDGLEPILAVEAVKSLTGFDEIAISQVFGKEFSELGQTMTVRALLFVTLRRNGASDSQAYRSAMTVSLGRLDGLFVKDEDAAASGDVDDFLDGRRPEA